MRLTIALVSSAILIAAVHGVAHTEASGTIARGSCRVVDGYASDLRLYVVQVATGTDSASAATRAAWNIPAIADSSQIRFVSDSTQCTRAAHAHAIAERADTLNPPPVYLLRVGSTRYVAYNGARAGEFLVHYVLDDQFNVLESF